MLIWFIYILDEAKNCLYELIVKDNIDDFFQRHFVQLQFTCFEGHCIVIMQK